MMSSGGNVSKTEKSIRPLMSRIYQWFADAATRHICPAAVVVPISPLWRMEQFELDQRRTVWVRVHVDDDAGDGPTIRVWFGDALATFVTTIDFSSGENFGTMSTKEIEDASHKEEEESIAHQATYRGVSWQIVSSAIECATSNSAVVHSDERVQMFLRVLERELCENECQNECE
jgi:hypothetical protein